jgi:TonB family protein
MNDSNHTGDFNLPDDLKSLDEELSSIRYEERASFQPELRAELARVWATEARRPRSSIRRHLAAAMLAGLLLGSAAVPSARASFVRLIEVLVNEPAPVEVAPPPITTPAPPVFEQEEEPVVIPDHEPIVIAFEPDPEPMMEEIALVVREPIVVLPQIVDRTRAEQLLQGVYPMYLQQRGVGGTVVLRLWIDESGNASRPNLTRSSGVSDLDRAALRVAPSFSFLPALQDGRRSPTWIQFPVVFAPDSSQVDRFPTTVDDPYSLPRVPEADFWESDTRLDLTTLPAPGTVVPEEREAREAAERNLSVAIEGAGDIGPLDAVLSGTVPQGIALSRWRETVGAALEAAIDDGSRTPASLIALGRLRLRQGLRTEARSHFERGLQIAILEGDRASPWVVAELHYERGMLVRDGWLSSNGVGRVRSSALSDASCPDVHPSETTNTEAGFVSSEQLVAWNYVCPAALSGVLDTGFEADASESSGDLTLMMASFRAAVEAYPGHVGANTHLLLALAAEGRWDDVLAGARRFTRVSAAHPNALLLAGLALHRLGETADAAGHFEAALERLSVVDADALRDIGFLLDESRSGRYRRLPASSKRAWEADYWESSSESSSADVNEREVEHLARAAYAQLRFGTVFGDVGEVWVRFGGPDAIHIVDGGSGQLTEFWDYGSGPDITFVRWVTSERTDLTPEGRAYVDDLGTIFPPQ